MTGTVETCEDVTCEDSLVVSEVCAWLLEPLCDEMWVVWELEAIVVDEEV